MTMGVYSITYAPTGEKYFGSSWDIEKRWYQHRYTLNHGEHSSWLMQDLWTTEGGDKFVFEIVEDVTDNESIQTQEQLREIEWKYILNYFNEHGSLGFSTTMACPYSQHHTIPSIKWFDLTILSGGPHGRYTRIPSNERLLEVIKGALDEGALSFTVKQHIVQMRQDMKTLAELQQWIDQQPKYS